MLRYAKDPERLLFTTTLKNTIQAYHLEDLRLLDPVHHHPSPPDVFALSSTSHLLLSASISPSIIQLTSFLQKSRSLTLLPQCSSTYAVAVEFHPERGNLFLLAFADGTCAMYDAAPLFRGSVGSERNSNASKADTGWEISHIKGLHVFSRVTRQIPTEYNPRSNGSDRSDSASVGDRYQGITAVGLVPGYKMIAVTVGSDGRCCVIDFTASKAREATLLASWNIGGPATCLSILTPNLQSGFSLPTASIGQHDLVYRTSFIAIGRQDGQVLLFDLDGNLLMHRIATPEGHAIIDLEWMEGSDWPEPSAPRTTALVSDKPIHRANRKSLGSVLAGGRFVAEEVITTTDVSGAGEGSREAKTGRTIPSGLVPDTAESKIHPAGDSHQTQEAPALNYLDFRLLPPAIKKMFPIETAYEDMSGRPDTSSSGSLGDILKNFQFPSPPQGIPPRTLPQHHWSREQPPKNNSWAAEEEPHSTITAEKTHSPHLSEVDTVAKGNSTKPALGSGRRKRRALEELKNGPVQVATNQLAKDHEELWADIDYGEGSPIEDIASTGKENNAYNDVSHKNQVNPIGTLDAGLNEKSDGQAPKAESHRGIPFTIHVDEPSDHPQPLSAHPGKAPTSGPLSRAPGNVNSSHSASVNRVPWYRQRYKNGRLDSHRSSIYGPGALARKVQQEVMITVNVELDVLRREMAGSLIEQRKWLVKELMNGQEWTLRVEEENRKLREELAKERRRKAVDREGARTLC